MIRSSLCDYSDPYIHVKGTITVPNMAAAGAAVNNTNKKVVFKNCALFTSCITKINNIQVDYAEDIDIVMPMYNLLEYSNAYLKTSGSLWQYYKDEPAIGANGNIIDFSNINNSFKFKQQITGQAGNGRTKDVEIMIPLKCLSNFWRTLAVSLINCEITLKLTCSEKHILAAGIAANQVPRFRITNTKLYVPVVTLSTQENIKLLKQLESGFKKTFDWINIILKNQVKLKTDI